MSTSAIGDVIAQVRAASTARSGPGAGADREQVRELAAKFESMLLVQMIRDMRQAGKWTDDSETGGLGAETYFDTLDVELANYLTGAQGIGLKTQLLDAFERATGTLPAAVAPAPLAPGLGVPGVTRGPGTQPAPPPAAAPGIDSAALRYRVAPGSVTSQYGWRDDPITGKPTFHRGIDVRAAYGQDIQAAGPGRVVFSGDQGGYGTTVVVEHKDGVQTRYAHLSAALVKAGDTVAAGQVLGRAGRSGRATGTHLHFEVTVNGRHVSPEEAGLERVR